MQEVILVKLGEIVLKGLNRRVFEDRLLKNIRRRIQRAGSFDVYSMQSTIYIVPKDADADIDEAEERVAKVFGVIGYTRACVCPKEMDAILETAPRYLEETLADVKTFKVESKRADKKFPLDSMQISREVGGALITGESLGQVASQTIQAIACTDAAADMPVFRPLIGSDKAEIVALARRIDTYDISIEPYEDCCTVFTPRHPRTRPTLQLVEAAERNLDVSALLEDCLAQVEVRHL